MHLPAVGGSEVATQFGDHFVMFVLFDLIARRLLFARDFLFGLWAAQNSHGLGIEVSVGPSVTLVLNSFPFLKENEIAAENVVMGVFLCLIHTRKVCVDF